MSSAYTFSFSMHAPAARLACRNASTLAPDVARHGLTCSPAFSRGRLTYAACPRAAARCSDARTLLPSPRARAARSRPAAPPHRTWPRLACSALPRCSPTHHPRCLLVNGRRRARRGRSGVRMISSFWWNHSNPYLQRIFLSEFILTYVKITTKRWSK